MLGDVPALRAQPGPGHVVGEGVTELLGRAEAQARVARDGRDDDLLQRLRHPGGDDARRDRVPALVQHLAEEVLLVRRLEGASARERLVEQHTTE
jgi:hypothetical protein